MTLVNASHLAQLLKGSTGYRGPFHLELEGGLMPVADLLRPVPEFDDGIIYWAATRSQGAVAGNFSSVGIVAATGRTIVDGLMVRGDGAALIIANLGLGSGAVGNAATVRNYGPGRAGTSLLTPNVSVQVTTGAAAPASPMFSASIAATSSSFLIPLQIVLDPAITPVINTLWVTNGALNSALSCAFFGRNFPSYPE